LASGVDGESDRPTETLTGAASIRATIRECTLTIIGGERDGTRHAFASERIVVGADPRADIVVDDSAMSRFHCELRTSDNNTIVVRDLGSRNGTTVDGVPILEAPLRDGAQLSVGRTRLRFDLGARHVAIALSPRERFGRLRGGSVPMRAVYAQLEAAVPNASTVLLLGESGTGKDLAAESLHSEGPRRDGPFIVVDCGAVPANLLEAELFGYEAGAFTGATGARAGALETAAGGTLFLDEIGELALDLQPKLLRALDRRETQRIGGTHRRTVDVRIIAATNRDLRAEVNAHRFRADLYYRLAVLVVRMPSLRERTADIPVLVDAILESLGDTSSPIARSLRSGELLPELLRHQWPGNVRELRNYVEASLARQEYTPAAATVDEPAIDINQPLRAVRERWVRHVERRYLEQLLAAHADNVSAAARAAGLDRVHLHRLLVRVGLR
jgi:two-component system response regulator GlrR